MEAFALRSLSFSYPEAEERALSGISFRVQQGEFVTLCGASGSGKSTLMRLLKPSLAPHGAKSGEILFEGEKLYDLDRRTEAQSIGFVQQSPENQIVTDKVWHELAFGLESLGCDSGTIRRRVAEMASFFGISDWFYKSVTELSGGQKQLLNLAAVMVMQPRVLLLDEPTSRLDPIAASDFLAVLHRINRELGTTVIIAEHRLDELFPISDAVLVMDGGRLIAGGTPHEIGEKLKNAGHRQFLSMPAAMRIWAGAPNTLPCPVTVSEGQRWLADFAEENELHSIEKQSYTHSGETAVTLKDLWFRYEKSSPDILKGLSLEVRRGEIFALMGGNGAGKSTLLAVMSGLKKPYRGRISLRGRAALLPQEVQTLFVKKTVSEELSELCPKRDEAAQERLHAVTGLCKLASLMNRHPYDLSGGEQQRLGLAKVLLTAPEILLLDEPTKGFDGEFKRDFAAILKSLKRSGVTIIMVSHDADFCAECADRCALMFDGAIVAEGAPGEFFSGNSFYTTVANRIARGKIANAVTVADVVTACGGETERPAEVGAVFPLRPAEHAQPEAPPAPVSRRLPKRTVAAAVMILLLIPLTIFVGVYYLGDRKYYFVSLLVLLEAMLPFALIFEGRKPQTRELVIIAVLCALGVAGRAAFFMLPQFKPVLALVIISGVAFGGEAGFLVGAVTMLVSNIFFGQGPWTPWQMFAMGIIGFLAGVLFRKGFLSRKKLPLCIFGAVSAVVIYGSIVNTASALMWSTNLNRGIILSYWLTGLPMDLVHAGATALFLWLAAVPMLEKLDRIKLKYGLLTGGE